MTEKNPVGKPRKYKSPEEMQEAIDAYFIHCKEKKENIKITGLALWLGFTSRHDLINYENYSEKYYHTIKRAKMKVEMAYEDRLINRGNGGDVFALKNFDWTDKQELNLGGQDGNPIENNLTVKFVDGDTDTESV